MEHDHGVGEPHDHAHVVLDQQDRHALLPDTADQAADHVLLGARHARRRLVQEQDGGPGGERDGQLDQPLLAVGQGAGHLAPPVGESDEGDDLLGGGDQRRFLVPHPAEPGQDRPEAGRAAQVHAGQHVVEHGQGREDARALEGANHTVPGDRRGRQAGQRPTVPRHPPAVRAEIAGDGVESRGLAGAVGADQAGDRAGPDVERDPGQRGDAAEPYGQVTNAEHGGPESVRCRGAGRRRAGSR
jgi:hypothetical protein